MARRNYVGNYVVLDGYGHPTYDLTRSQARKIVREWRQQGYTSPRGSPLWKSNEQELRRMSRIPALRQRPALITEISGFYGTDANIQLRTLLEMDELASLADDTRSERMIMQAYEMTLDYWAGNISHEAYRSFMERVYARCVSKGYWDPSDPKRNGERWRYRAEA